MLWLFVCEITLLLIKNMFKYQNQPGNLPHSLRSWRLQL